MQTKTLLYTIFVISLMSTLWSIYISTFGDPRTNILSNELFNRINGLPSCTFCRYIRICMFPLVLISAVAIRKNDTTIRKPIVALSSIWRLLSVYIYGIEMQRWTKSSELCGINTIVECGTPPILYRWWFTLAAAGMITFGGILASCLVLRKKQRTT